MPKGGNGGGGGGKPGGGGGGVNQINGHDKKDDTLIGTDGKDAILGKGGNDTLSGLLGDDFLSGGNGDDWLYGYDDSDYTLAAGETDNDRLFGGDGDDHLFGGDGDDELQGGAGIDELDGGDGWDVAYYMETPEYIDPVTEMGTSEGITVTAFDDASGEGYIIDFPSGDQEIAENIEAIAATNHDDTMTGDGGDDWFDGAGGNDTISGEGGDDSINGGGGNDTIDGGAGNDTLSGGSGNDMITPGTGDDRIDGGANAWWEQSDHDIVSYAGESGGAGLNLTGAFVPLFDSKGNIVGETYSYTALINGDEDFLWNVEEIRGTDDADTMTGSDDGGDDHFVGGGSGDTLDGKAGNDTASYVGSGAGVIVDLSDGLAETGGDAAGDILISIENLIGSDHNDTLTGGAGGNRLTGGLGADNFVYNSAAEGGDSLTDFSGAGGEGDTIDLVALNLDGGAPLAGLITDGFIALIGNKLWIDLDGTDGIDGNVVGGAEDDILIATFTDGGAEFDIDFDVLV